MPNQISYEDLVSVAQRFDGSTLDTIGGRAKFSVSLLDGAVYCTPASSGIARKLGSGTKKALDRFNETGSFVASDYSDLTRHASYFLALVAQIRR